MAVYGPVYIMPYDPQCHELFAIYEPVVYGRPGTCIILDKKYNIANSSCHFGSYGSIWTGPSTNKYYMDPSFGPYTGTAI